MPAIIPVSNPTSPAKTMAIKDESTNEVVAYGYLTVDMLPSRAGDRLGSLVFVATEVLLPDATPTVMPTPPVA